MCFPNSTHPEKDVESIYNLEDGSIIESDSHQYIPESIHEHIDNYFLNTEEYDSNFLGFIYENCIEVILVWTSAEGILLFNQLYE